MPTLLIQRAAARFPAADEASGPAAPPAGRNYAAARVGATMVLAVTLSVALPLWAFKGVDLEQSWRLVCQCRLLDLALAGVCVLLSLALRAARWQALLAARQRVRLRSCLSGICVGLFANNVLPFRLGDLLRVGVVRHHEGGSAAAGLGTVAVERALDLLTLVALLGGYVLLGGVGAEHAGLLVAGRLALLGGGVLAAALVLGYWRRAWVQRMAAAPVAWVNPRAGARVAALVGHFLDGLRVFVTLGQTLAVLGLSAAWWAAAAGAYYFVGAALGLDVPAWAYVLVLVVTSFGALIPAAPGSVGTFHGFARLGLFLVSGVSGEAALAYAAIMHGLDWVLVSGTGLYFVACDRLWLALPFARRASRPAATETLALQPVVSG